MRSFWLCRFGQTRGHSTRRRSRACFLPYGDIAVWRTNSESGQDLLEFELVNGLKIAKKTFETGKAYRTLYPFIKEKEYNYIRIKKNKEEQPSIPEAFENIKKKYFRK